MQETDQAQLAYDGRPFDVLLINGSIHRAGKTGSRADIAEKYLRERNVSFRRNNLSEHRIDYCWCCSAVKGDSCAFRCRNKNDDMPAFHAMLASSKAVIVASPINWNGMSARLKTFLDRTTCMENLYHIGKPTLTEGKVAGILVNGYEDGAIKTAMDIWLNFQQLGYVPASFGIAFRTHGSEFNGSTGREFFLNDNLIVRHTRGVANNVIEMMQHGFEKKLKGKLVPVTE